MVRDVLVGATALLVAFVLAAWWDGRLAVRSEALENTRFVRQVAVDGSPLKPFGGLVLRGAELSGLELGCEDVEAARAAGFADERLEAGCADFRGADLRGAVLVRTGLDHALLYDVDMRDADLTLTHLRGAEIGADFRGAQMFKTDLSEASLVGSDLTGVAWTDVCYDDATQWPPSFQPPADPVCTDSGDRVHRIVDEGADS